MLTRSASRLLSHRLLVQRYSLALSRGLFASGSRLKWDKEGKGPQVVVGWNTGHPDDPIFNTRDKDYRGTASKGDKIRPEYMYRQTRFDDKLTYLDHLVTYSLTAFFWFWVTYHTYYHSGHVIGHWYMPYLSEFTDEELGIPPDDAPDPEYWGNHCEPYGTYR